MTSYISYQEIPIEERKQLAKRAFRESTKLHLVMFALLAVSLIISDIVSDFIYPRPRAAMPHFAVGLLVAIALSLVGQWLFYFPRLKTEIEKLKNSANP